MTKNGVFGLFTVKMDRPGEWPCRDRPPCRSMERGALREPQGPEQVEGEPVPYRTRKPNSHGALNPAPTFLYASGVFMRGGGLRLGHERLRDRQISADPNKVDLRFSMTVSLQAQRFGG